MSIQTKYKSLGKLDKYLKAVNDYKKNISATEIIRKYKMAYNTLQTWTKNFSLHDINYWKSLLRKKIDDRCNFNLSKHEQTEKDAIIEDLYNDKRRNLKVVSEWSALYDTMSHKCSRIAFCQKYNLHYNIFLYLTERLNKIGFDATLQKQKDRLKRRALVYLKTHLEKERDLPCINLDGKIKAPLDLEFNKEKKKHEQIQKSMAETADHNMSDSKTDLKTDGDNTQTFDHETGSKQRLTVQISESIIERAKNAVYWTRGLTLARLTEEGLEKVLTDLEENILIWGEKTNGLIKSKGEKFPERAEDLKPGRPIR